MTPKDMRTKWGNNNKRGAAKTAVPIKKGNFKMNLEMKKELLGLIPDWRNNTDISDELYDLLCKWTHETAE